MAKVIDSVSVKVQDLGIEGDKRRYSVLIEAKESQFALSDILSKEGALKSLTKRLKSEVTSEVVDYIGAGKKALRNLKTKETEAELRNDA